MAFYSFENSIKDFDEYESLSKMHIELCYDVVQSSKGSNPKKAEINRVMEGILKLQHEQQNLINIAKEEVQKVKDSDDLTELSTQYEQRKQELLRGTFDPRTHPAYFKLVDMLNRLDNDAAASADSTDDDIQMVQAEISTKCPITGAEMLNPVMNPICKHQYDRIGVEGLVRQRGKKAKCPVVGCGNKEPIILMQLQAV